jgi:hypothetical protein
VRRFVRTSDDELTLDLAQWTWAVNEAAQALHLSFDTGSIRFPISIQRPTLVLYNRKWHHLGKRREEMFESIRDGAELTFEVMLTSVSEDETRRPPTAEEFRKVMECVGKTIGLSPWGSKYSYGRFKVLSLTEK